MVPKRAAVEVGQQREVEPTRLPPPNGRDACGSWEKRRGLGFRVLGFRVFGFRI